MSVPLVEVIGLQLGGLGPISLRIEAGTRVAIVGPSGVGKTLLLRAIAQLDRREGQVLWRGQAVPDGELPLYRSRVTYLSQRWSLQEGTVEQNLRAAFEWGVYREAGKRWNQDFISARLSRFGLPSEFLGRVSRELSGGEAQIVSLLRTLQLGPTILLLDEPTSALDPARVAVAESLVREWREEAAERAYLWVTHHESQAPRVSDHTLRVEPGGLTLSASQK